MAIRDLYIHLKQWNNCGYIKKKEAEEFFKEQILLMTLAAIYIHLKQCNLNDG